jgi:hypothetical protein
MEKIRAECGKTLVIFVDSKTWNDGLTFVTDDSNFLQVGTWLYDKGKKLDRHYHNIVPRENNITQECVAVLTGELLVKIYDLQQRYVTEFHMYAGDFAVFLEGGHEYEILEDRTRIIETKNGPFPGVDLDKTRF